MTLNNILSDINKNTFKDFALLNIHEEVDLININYKDCFCPNSMSLYNFFLIKNRDKNSLEKYVGIILDMGESNLHIFIKEEYRGNKYLQNVMNQAVLYYLANTKGRKMQSLSFESVEVKEYFIREFGFKDTGAMSVSLKLAPNTAYKVFRNSSSTIGSTCAQIEKKELTEMMLRLKILDRQLYNSDIEKYVENEKWNASIPDTIEALFRILKDNYP